LRPAWQLLDLGRIVEIRLKGGIASPRRFEDYEVLIHRDRVPNGVEIEELL